MTLKDVRLRAACISLVSALYFGSSLLLSTKIKGTSYYMRLSSLCFGKQENAKLDYKKGPAGGAH